MDDSPKPNLRLVTPDDELFDRSEFTPLPFYSWDQRPSTVPLDDEEVATALALAHGSPDKAAALLRIPLTWLNRVVKRSPRLSRLLAELNEVVVLKAQSVPIDTLFDPNADARRLEWASTKILSSRLASASPFAPAPAATTASASLTLSKGPRTVTYRWRTDADDSSPPDDAA